MSAKPVKDLAGPGGGTASVAVQHTAKGQGEPVHEGPPPPTRFAVFDHIAHKNNITVNERLKEFVWEVRLADELGLDYYFTAEHHFSRDFGLSPSQPITLATIAQNSERIRFGPMTYQIPISQPLRVAEEVLILDHMSNGRLEVGVGRGIVSHEPMSYGVRPELTNAMFREGLELMLKAWTMDEKFSFLGEYNQYFDLEVPWRPLQQPHPPIWVPTATPSNAEEWGRRGYRIAGFSWLGRELHHDVFAKYREGWKESGLPRSEQQVGYLSSYVVAPTDAEAREIAEEHFPKQVELFEYEEGRSHWFGDTDAKRVYSGLLELFKQIKKPEFSEPEYMIIHGSPETVTGKMKALQEELGINTFLSEFSFGLQPWETVERSYQLFAKEVMPNFERTAAPLAAVTG
ncbi:MAG: LLM class flavin-dependent oxidoreductase [Acidimicrobiia bacterium]